MLLRNHFALLLSLPALLLMSAAPTEAGKYDFRVTGVRRSDVLNIRERVDDQATISQKKILGQIPANSSGVLGSGASIMVGSTRWYEIHFKGIRGWVNGRFLKPTSSRLDDEFQSNLFCGGTEPFWALRIEGDTAELRRPEGPPVRYKVAVREPFQGRDDAIAMRFVSDSGTDISALIQNKEWCNDGMSDLEYAFEAHIVGLSDATTPLQGCCSLLR